MKATPIERTESASSCFREERTWQLGYSDPRIVVPRGTIRREKIDFDVIEARIGYGITGVCGSASFDGRPCLSAAVKYDTWGFGFAIPNAYYDVVSSDAAQNENKDGCMKQ